MATKYTQYKPPTADWYQKNMPGQIAEQQSTELGISKDQLYKMYSTYAQQFPGQRNTWEPTYTPSQQTYTPGGGSGATPSTTVSPSPGYSWIQQQVNTQKGQQVLNPQQLVQQAAPQWQMPQLTPRQPTPTVPITPLAPTAQFGAATQAAAPSMNVPQASAPGATPLFSLGAGQQNWMLPQAQAQPPQMPYATGMQATPGLQPYQPVQKFQSGGPVKQNQPQTGYQTGTSDPGAGTGWYDPLYAGSALGAFALGMPLVVNPTPSGTPSAKSGVAAVGQPTVYGQPAYTGGPITLPGGQTFSAEQVAGFSPADWAEVGKVGVQRPMPSPIQGPWSFQPGLFNKAPMPTVGTTQAPGWTGNPQMPLTAQTPANAAQMPQMNITPAANAGAAVPQMTLASGYPMPAMGIAGRPVPPGAPGVVARETLAQPGRYTGELHDDPFLSHAVSTLMGFPSNPWHDVNPHTGAPYGGQAAAGAGTALATGPVIVPSGGKAAPKKMAGGGPVNGQGDDDNVPALLTPGEYVLNKQQVKQLVQGRPVQLGQLPQAPQQPQRVQQPQQVQQGQPVSSPTAATPNLPTGGGAWPQAPGTRGPIAPMSALGTTAYQGAPGGGMTVGQLGNQPMPGAAQTMSLGQAPGIGGVTPNQASAIGGLGQGIAQAVQTWANSVKPWQTQASAIPSPDDFRRKQQDISLQEPRVV